MMNTLALIISCEHAVNTIPSAYQSLFKPFKDLLNSHEGFDCGALEIALHLKKVFSCELIQAPTSRLLIDYNRSVHNHCFSTLTKKLSPVEKQNIINQYYLPYRQQVIQYIEHYLSQGVQVLHCSIHSFTPILNNKIRTAEIGFLYDPSRILEKKLTHQWRKIIKEEHPEYRIKMNYPYQGISDGLTTTLRQKYPPDKYLGIEMEVNQELTKNEHSFLKLKNTLSLSLFKLITFELN